MEILELMKQRHSVRQYKDIAVVSKQRTVLNELIEKSTMTLGCIFRFFMMSRSVSTL